MCLPACLLTYLGLVPRGEDDMEADIHQQLRRRLAQACVYHHGVSDRLGLWSEGCVRWLRTSIPARDERRGADGISRRGGGSPKGVDDRRDTESQQHKWEQPKK